MKEIVHPQLGKFIVLQAVGTGTYATVYKAKHAESDMIVALKVYNEEIRDNTEEMELIEREVQIMKDVWHPLVVNLYDRFEYKNRVIFLSEFIDGDNLLEYANERAPLRESEVRNFFAQMILIMEYVHKEKKIVHRDLKCENFMVDRYNNIHLIDFGFANVGGANSLYNTTCGSPGYIAPEIIKNQPYDASVDIWSLGVILYAITHQRLPFDESNTSKMLAKIVFSEPEYDQDLSPDLLDLIQIMLKKNPKQRATIEQIKKHPWLTIDENSRQFTLDDSVLKQFPLFPKNEKMLLVEEEDKVDIKLDQYTVAALSLSEYQQSEIIKSFSNHEVTSLTLKYKIARKCRIASEIAMAVKMIFRPVIARQAKRVSTFGPQHDTSIKLPLLMVLNNKNNSKLAERKASKTNVYNEFSSPNFVFNNVAHRKVLNFKYQHNSPTQVAFPSSMSKQVVFRRTVNP